MKRILLVGFLIGSSMHALAVGPIETTKTNRGVFGIGWRYVTETVGEGRHTLNCDSPGWSRCKSSVSIEVDETLTVSEQEFETIDNKVDEAVKNGSRSGKFVFDNKAVVTYTYDSDNDVLKHTIYSLTQAQAAHII